MSTIVINPDGSVLVVGSNTTAAPNPPVVPAQVAPTANTAPVAPTANTAPVAPAANTAPVAPAATPAPVGNNAGQQGGVMIINPNNPAPQPAPAPIVAGPTTFVAQQTVDGGNRFFPNWVIWIIVSIFLLLLIFGGYILYQSGKDSSSAPATPVVKVINTGGPKTAVDPKAIELATEANTKANLILQERENEKRIEAEAKEKEKNKESEKPDCSNNLADWLKF
jgi:hypothetical protein